MKKESKAIKIHKSKLLTSLFVATVILSVSASAFVPAREVGQIRNDLHKSADNQTQVIWYVNDSAIGLNNGTSWTDAFNDLQDAIAAASAGNQIWVATGEYTPVPRANGPYNEDSSEREISFQINEGVAIYGGFAGNEQTFEERADLFDQTILTGDLNGDDEITWDPPHLCEFDNYDDNSYHVVNATNVDNAFLDGFNITHGCAGGDGSWELKARGAGIYVFGSNMTIRNCTIMYNKASVSAPSDAIGAGIYSNDNNLTIRSCIIIRNQNQEDKKGAIYLDSGDIEIKRSTISENDGNGIYYVPRTSEFENITISDCVISDNNRDGITFYGIYECKNRPGGGYPLHLMNITNSTVSDNRGTGIIVTPESSFGNPWAVNISCCTISGNGDEDSGTLVGGGIRFATGSYEIVTVAMISNSIITNNIAPHGGGIYSNGANLMIKNCMITNNTAKEGSSGSGGQGGGIHGYCTNMIIKNSMIINNMARSTIDFDGQGGGIYLAGTENLYNYEIDGCTIANNTAEGSSDDIYTGSQGGGIRATGLGDGDIHSVVAIINSILWNNTAKNGSEIAVWNNMIVSVDYSDVEGGEDEVGLVDLHPPEEWWYPDPILEWGTANIVEDPLFVKNDGATWEDNDYHITAGSPCIDMGDPSYIPDPGETDIDGEPRVVDGDEDGSAIIDMGADEYYGLWWPMFHHDPKKTGFSTSTAPNTNQTKWITHIGGDFLESSPAVQNDKVYIGSKLNKLHCVDAETGDYLWNYTTLGRIGYSSPAVYDNKVYIGSAELPWNGTLYCVNADNGTEIWNYTTDASIYSSPTVNNGYVYIGSHDRNVYCFDADPTDDGIDEGISDNGAPYDLVWKYATKERVTSSPAVYDNKVYVGSIDGKLYCLNAENGQYQWNYTTQGAISYSSTGINGRLYFGSWDHNVYCINATDGELIWIFTTCEKVLSSPAVAYGNIYVGSYDNKTYCLPQIDENGDKVIDSSEEIWNYTTGKRVFASPAVADDKVYIGSRDGVFYCLNAYTGDPIWNYTTTGAYPFDGIGSSPAIADGKVFMASTDGYLYAFGELTL